MPTSTEAVTVSTTPGAPPAKPFWKMKRFWAAVLAVLATVVGVWLRGARSVLEVLTDDGVIDALTTVLTLAGISGAFLATIRGAKAATVTGTREAVPAVVEVERRQTESATVCPACGRDLLAEPPSEETPPTPIRPALSGELLAEALKRRRP